MSRLDNMYKKRLASVQNEMHQLHEALYHNEERFNELVALLEKMYRQRSENLKKRDRKKVNGPEWYLRGDVTGMMMNAESYGGTLQGVEDNLLYLEENGIKLFHLKPLLVKGNRKIGSLLQVDPKLGSMADLADLAAKCHLKNISLCLDYELELISDSFQDPEMFNEAVCGLLLLANHGIDVIRISGPVGLRQFKLMKLALETVCPGTIAVCDKEDASLSLLSYNDRFNSAIWHTMATKDVRLLQHELAESFALQDKKVCLNYLRNFKPVNWNLDYRYLEEFGINEEAHKHYLSEYLTGNFAGSESRGELYEGAVCATTASLCGLETALYQNNEEKARNARKWILMLHGFLLSQSGIPVIYSGDELGQLNDYSYHFDSARANDARNLYAGKFDWKKVRMSHDNEIYQGLKKLRRIRSEHDVFVALADCWILEPHNEHILALGRYYQEEKLLALFNFSDQEETAWLGESETYVDLLTGEELNAEEVRIQPGDFRWLYLRYSE